MKAEAGLVAGSIAQLRLCSQQNQQVAAPMSHSTKAAVFLTGSIGVVCAIVYSVHAQQTEDQVVS
jgi:hypothetical protein